MTHSTRHTILWLLLGIVSTCYAGGASQTYYEWLKIPSAELLQKANGYNHAGLRDSAMLCYTIIADRYTPQSPVDEAALTVKALNEMGVLNTSYYNDHTAAYQNLLKARDIGRKIGMMEMQPYILLNLGNLYNIYEFLFPPADSNPQAGKYYEQCFRASCRIHNWEMAISSYINFVMLNMPYGVGDASVHREMTLWLRDSIPHSTADWQLASRFLEGNMALVSRKPSEARKHYRLMMNELEPDKDIPRDQYMVLTCIEASFLSEERYDSAIVYAKKILQLESKQDLTDIHIETYRFLAEYYKATGNNTESTRYHTAYLEGKEQLMKGIVGLVPTQLSHDLETVSAEINKMKEQKRLQNINFVVAVVIITLLVVFTIFIIFKNRQLRQKNLTLYHQMREIISMEKPAGNGLKYKESTLKEEKKLMLVEEIRKVMGDADAICQPTFTLQTLAERLSSNTSYLSQTINENFGMTFTSLLNQYRIREACRRMEDQQSFGHLTIDAISESVGFKARVTFTKAFRQYVGMLPSEYIKTVRLRQS